MNKRTHRLESPQMLPNVMFMSLISISIHLPSLHHCLLLQSSVSVNKLDLVLTWSLPAPPNFHRSFYISHTSETEFALGCSLFVF